MDPLQANLSRMERAALALARFTNERPGPKKLQEEFLQQVAYRWVRPSLAARFLVDVIEEVVKREPDRGILMVSNHRSFFDQYSILLSIWMSKLSWGRRMYFPVRANFFYDNPLGVAVNYLIGGGVMYPPIYRQTERKELNDDALERSVRFLQEPGTVVGVHPEGTRGKGPDPYQLLPAQPGVGKIALLANPIILPWFINGLSNSIVDDVLATQKPGIRRIRPVIAVAGAPIDISDLLTSKPRPTLYKKAADRFMKRIAELGQREKELRAQCIAGEISDDDSRWMVNRV